MVLCLSSLWSSRTMILFVICLACFCSPTPGLTSTSVQAQQPTRTLAGSPSSGVLQPSGNFQSSTAAPAIPQSTQNLQQISSVSSSVVLPASSVAAQNELSSVSSSVVLPASSVAAQNELSSVSSSVILPASSVAAHNELSSVSSSVVLPANSVAAQNELSSVSSSVVLPASSVAAQNELSSISSSVVRLSSSVAPQNELRSTTSKIQPSKTTENIGSTSFVPNQTPSDGSKLFKPEFPKVDAQTVGKETQYEGYDGWYNNRGKHDLGAVVTRLTRRVPSQYEDGVYQPSGSDRPNPFTLSKELMNGNSSGCVTNKNVLLVFFGQQVVDEIVDSRRPSCPPEYSNIDIPNDYKLYKSAGDPKRMPFVRTRYDQTTGKSPGNPRQQLNEVTPWIDGGLVYGTSKVWANELRSFKGGKLAKSDKGNWPAENDVGLPMDNPPPPTKHELLNSERLFKLGNRRGNENPFLLSLGIMWFRYHNLIAERLQAKNFANDDDKLFNEARKWVIATHQKIVFYDWLPAFLGVDPKMFKDKAKYAYNPLANPTITQTFQSAAMRIGHTMVPPVVMRRLENSCEPFNKTSSGKKMGIRLCNSYWDSKAPIEEKHKGKLLDIDAILRGMTLQTAACEDHIVTEDLRGYLYGGLEFSRRDLMALNIQRGRDHGLSDYNSARRAYGLSRKSEFLDIKDAESNIPDEIFHKLKNLSNSDIDNIDVWVGGLLETSKSGPGELFSAVIEDQFRRIRDADRLWFENTYNGLFTDDQIEQIKSITLYDVIRMTTEINENDLQKDVFHVDKTICPNGLPELRESDIEKCTSPETYDYFDGSEVSYALTFLFIALFIVGVVVVMFLLSRKRQKFLAERRKKNLRKTQRRSEVKDSEFIAAEWRRNLPDRPVKIAFPEGHTIRISSSRGELLRTIDLRGVENMTVCLENDGEETLLSARTENEYDLIIKFSTTGQRQKFVRKLQAFLEPLQISCTCQPMRTSILLATATTKEDRQKKLEQFFRLALANAFNIDYDDEETHVGKDVLTCELSREEFAEALSLKQNSKFVELMFNVCDKDRNGYVSFKEFLDVIIIFSKGSSDEKLRLFFDMYDVSGDGKLDQEEFRLMINSFMELVNADVESDHVHDLTETMFSQPGFEGKTELTFDDFKSVMGEYLTNFDDAQLNLSGTGLEVRRGTLVDLKADLKEAKKRAKKRRRSSAPSKKVTVRTQQSEVLRHPLRKRWIVFANYIENRISGIFIIVLYTLIVFAIFAERAYYYSVEREHSGLRQVAGYGVTVSRGSASAMMFTYSSLLVTMCRNLITFLRETFVGHIIPFDNNVFFHKYVAVLALFFTVLHCIGHGINFYHFSTQPVDDVLCLFSNTFQRTHKLPSFHFWCWTTITGVTGVLLILNIAIIYVFAMQYSRRHCFRYFWSTHQLYVTMYILTFLHGSGNLIQPSFFYYFFLGPGILFTLDKLVSISRKKVDIAVVKAELLPSDITNLQFKRPANFDYKAGQWCRIACQSLGGGEYHPFTLTSAPHEDNLSLHIRAVGPWTINLRQTYERANVEKSGYPQLYVDGPFGEGHQDWYRFEVSVLVGGGIGVTPFASILKDIAHKGNIKSTFSCKKVYFIWVTRSQKHFEWLTDIIREVEEKDTNNLVSVHIFVTQIYREFDLRTTMLYICERHFQKVAGKSLLTGLCSTTHFGRPDFLPFLESLSSKTHPWASKIGVFSCGPPAMTKSVESACTELNKTEGAAFIHHFENF